jgi:outer membrane protein OmpA-like peptidoglycan-associated protein
MRRIILTAFALAPLLSAASEPAKRFNAAADVFSEVMSTPDKGIPEELLKNAHCVVIVPALKTAAFVVGAKYGLKQENETQRLAAQADLERAAKEKAQAEAERTQLRADLLLQFNAILQTRDTARGLIVNMSDVLFDTAKHSLRPVAREKLAKVAGIISGDPGLRLDVEG